MSARGHLAPSPTEVPRLLSGDQGLDAHLRRWGPRPLGAPGLVDEVERAALRGRGGAGFPTAVKMRAVSSGRPPVVVANGVEREPVSHKDKTLLACAPHLVLDGLSLTAESVGASDAVLCVDRSAPAALTAVARALTERARAGVDRVPIRVETTPSAYVTGEETALVHWLNGGPAKPTYVPPRPFERGVGRRPTLINNVETLAHLALIARFGAGWFRAVGTDREPGTALVTVTGEVARPGVYETAFGVPLGQILSGASPTGNPAALLVGGFSGAWIPFPAASATTFDSASLKSLRASVGCAAITVLGAGSCGLAETARAVRWMAGQSAGQCGPCVHGLPALADAFDALVRGDRRGSASRRLASLVDVIPGRGACHHPDGVVRMVRSALAVFASDIEAHRSRGPCRVRTGVLAVPALTTPEWR